MSDTSLVKNAADAQQVKRGARKEQDTREQLLADVRACLALPAFRRLCQYLIGFCQVYAPIWDPSAKIHYYAGQQSVGQELVRLLNAASPDADLEVLREGRARERLDGLANQSARTLSTTTM
jgi:hypothetical protein